MRKREIMADMVLNSPLSRKSSFAFLPVLMNRAIVVPLRNPWAGVLADSARGFNYLNNSPRHDCNFYTSSARSNPAAGFRRSPTPARIAR